jgi:prolyl-tRNA editing enzyme YbaK/EbsC (Cys-tRNA(Pro) deacylase)
LNAAATAIGIPVSQLQQELSAKSLAQVAQAHGKNPGDVAKALKNAEHQRIDQAVASGRLTADEATQQKQREDRRIDQQITQVTPAAAPWRSPRRSRLRS